jgi:hypothetical protein
MEITEVFNQRIESLKPEDYNSPQPFLPRSLPVTSGEFNQYGKLLKSKGVDIKNLQRDQVYFRGIPLKIISK